MNVKRRDDSDHWGTLPTSPQRFVQSVTVSPHVLGRHARPRLVEALAAGVVCEFSGGLVD